MKKLEVKHSYGESKLSNILMQMLYCKLETYDAYADKEANERCRKNKNEEKYKEVEYHSAEGEEIK